MLHCANPGCDKETQYFREGRLFMIDDPGNRKDDCGAHATRKVVWLCRDCSQRMIAESWQQDEEKIPRRAPLLAAHPTLLLQAAF
jgi:hypothetical protein